MLFRSEGLAVLLLGEPEGGALGGSEYVARATGEVKGKPPTIDLEAEARLQRLVLALLRDDARAIGAEDGYFFSLNRYVFLATVR